MDYEKLYSQYTEKSLHERYITLTEIEPLLQKFNSGDNLKIIGHSVLGKPIYKYELGSGKTRILLWSQMHGNESTTTKALFDFLNLLNGNSEFANNLLNRFTFCCLPMLNPDGAALYTRENANKVDLNRDSQTLSQPESKLLRETFESFKPDFCYNLHDQRTIYGTEGHNLPATVSFLAPSFNQACDINDVRTQAISVIVAMNRVLQNFIPKQVGRFDDSFNINCVGDTFQNLNVPTILIEAGHFPNDFEREMTRKYIFIAMIAGFQFLESKENNPNAVAEYLVIPENKVFFYDIIYKNVSINYDNKKIIANIAIQNKEELVNDTVLFEAYIESIGDLKGYFGHFEFDAKTELYTDDLDNIPQINQKADFYIGKSIKIVNGLIKM